MGKPRKVKPANSAAGKKQAPKYWARRDKPTTAELLWNKVVASADNNHSHTETTTGNTEPTNNP